MSKGDDDFLRNVEQAFDKLGGAATETPPNAASGPRRRRGVRPEHFSTLASLTLVEDDGLYRWVYEPPPCRSGKRRARRISVKEFDGEPKYSVSIEHTPPNQLLAALGRLDDDLTPNKGLGVLTWDRQKHQFVFKWTRQPKIDAQRVLLLVHGTFSNSDMFLRELQATKVGEQYLKDLTKAQIAVVAFDHPTLSVGSWINALDLEAQLINVSGEFDVVCHSRGGLVVAWWLRLAKRKVRNVLFVGSPLDGTSLASPDSIRHALDYLANAAKVISTVATASSTVLPFMMVVSGLAKVLGGALRLGAALPIVDAAVVTVPGLASQSRVGNNAEIIKLFELPWPSRPKFYAVTSNFKPKENSEGWKVWRRLSNVGDQVKYAGAQVVFKDSNDLVVDTGCMLGPKGILPFERIEQFNGASPTVHHTNYFRQLETVNLMSALL